MSIRDPFYVKIEQALGTVQLDTGLFERLAAELVKSKGFNTNLAVGGADNGYDFELLDTTLEPGPGVVTTSDRVTENLKRNLNRNKVNCPRAAKKTYIVTSSVLTSRKRDNLKKAAQECGYTYLGASDRYDVALYLYSHPRWAKELLGLTGQPSALSVFPISSRPLTDVPLVGREHAIGRLCELVGDALLVGSPGSGKTALLSRLVSEGMGSFMVCTDMVAVANDVREQQPKIIIIDDLENSAVVTRELMRLRSEIGAVFKIIVTDWENNPELQQVLGLANADIIMLDLLTRDEIVSVVESLGICGPRSLVREIVNQAEGVPGLAVTLSHAALAGDYVGLFEGNRLGILMESTVNRLLGSSREGARAVHALGVISLSGDAGLTLEEIAGAVGVSKGELQEQLRRLLSGGIVRSYRNRVTLRPRPLRRYMLRKAFFGEIAADHTSLLAMVPNLGETAKELILASRAGALIPDLLEIVLTSNSQEAARYYAGTGERQARELLEAAPDMAIHVATEALHSSPETVIPLLLNLAVGDQRALHNTLDQPLRLIKDWANSGVPGHGDAVARKLIVIRSALKWAEKGNDFETVCRACSEALRTVFEGGETDPGAGMTFHMIRGMLTDKEIEQLYTAWDELRAAIEKVGEAHWPSLISACWELIHPHIYGEHPPRTFRSSRRLGERVIKDIGKLAAAHPGVLDRLNTMLRQVGNKSLYAVPEDYAALFGQHEHSDWRREQKKRSEQIARLADKWAIGDPVEFATRLAWLLREAAVAGSDGVNRSPLLCQMLAERVNNPGLWLTSLLDARPNAACILPFLERTVHGYPKNWEEVVLPMIENLMTVAAAVDVALKAPQASEAVWAALSPKLAGYLQYVNTLCQRRQVPQNTLRRLLQHESVDVTHAAAVGMWIAEPKGTIPDELRQEWEDAVVTINDDEYWLKEMLAFSSAVAHRWLEARIENDDWRALRNRENVQVAVAELDDVKRLELINKPSSRSWREDITAILVGDSEHLYRQVLCNQSLGSRWENLLQRKTDLTWRRNAGIALVEGRSPREIAEASMLRSYGWTGPHSAYLQEQIEEVTAWLEDPSDDVREVARQIFEWLSASRDQALMDERREAIEGRI